MSDSHQARQLLLSVKAAANCQGPATVIPVASPPIALLRPVATGAGRLNDADVHVLTQWRNRFVRSFLTEFEATKDQTAKWLTETVGPSDQKILFMVDDPQGRTFAYMGLDRIDWDQQTGEADAIVRGGEAARGTMRLCLTTLIQWAKKQLELKSLTVRVRSDNPATRFYEKVGFHPYERVPLRRVSEANMTRWVEDPESSDDRLSLVYMRWNGR